MPFIIRNKDNNPQRVNVINADIHVAVFIGSFKIKSPVMLLSLYKAV